jgi:protein-disulfide isomerase
MISHVKLRIPISEKDHVQGLAKAPLSLLLYGDYECPHSAHANSIIASLRRCFGDSLRFVFRHFPISQIHPSALNAAMAAEAADKQGKFWKMHDLLFENQRDLDQDVIVKCARQLNLNMEEFANDAVSPETESRILYDVYGGASSGISSTPTIYINGFRFSGSVSYSSLLQDLLTMRAAIPRSQRESA